MTRLTAVTLAALCVIGSAVASAQDVAVSVAEPRGIAREAFPASGGIPFKAGQVKSVDDLSLVDAGGKPVAAQFSKLAGYEDGSVQWALCDVLADVPADGETAYTVRIGAPAAAPAKPLNITETDDAVTVDTGVVKFVVSKKSFQLFDSVTVGGKPVVTGGEVSVLGGKGVWYVQNKQKQWEENVNDTQAGKLYQAGRPRQVAWEYRGPLRATLRVDGDYVGEGGATWLSYTARITAWAGSGVVRVRFTVRNSNPAAGDDAYIARAPLKLKLAVDLKDQGSGQDWAAGGDGQVGLLLQHRHTAGIYRGPATYLNETFGTGGTGLYSKWEPVYGQSAAGREASVDIIGQGPRLDNAKQRNGGLGFTKDGVFALADRAHKESSVWLDFYTGSREAAANESRAHAFRSKLLVTATPRWYSDTQALGVGHFGTLQDEIDTYKKWGWKGWDDASKYPQNSDLTGKIAKHEPFAYTPGEQIHNVTEDDVVQGFILQFVRTGARGFFDWAEAWDGFYRGHAIERTDWGPKWGLNGPEGQRESKGQAFSWYTPHVYDWADTRMHGCHHYGRGIFDYYCLTGDTDSLQAGLDLADDMNAGWDKYKPGGDFAFKRSFGRQFLTVLRAWQLTRSEKYKKICDAYAAMVLEAKNWQPELNLYHQSLGIKNSYFARDYAKGFFDTKSNPGWAKVLERSSDPPQKMQKYLRENKIVCFYDRGDVKARKGEGDDAEVWEVTYLTQLFELSACHMALERYAVLSGSEAMKKRLVEVAEGVNRHYWSETVDYMIGSPWFGWPIKDKVTDPYFWSDKQDFRISGYATRYTADMFARAYYFTKDKRWLELAKRSWDRGSKRGYNAPEPFAGPDEIGQFAFVLGPKSDTLIECAARLFYVTTQMKE